MSLINLLPAFSAGVPHRSVITFEVASCDDDSPGGASAGITIYHSEHSTKAGECYGEESQVEVLQFVFADPGTAAAGYQFKWEPLTGDEPNVGDVKSVWHDITSNSFGVAWSVGASSELTGDITVTYRLNTGPVLGTVVWDASVIAQGKGK